jgi:hypothetical protein
MITAQHVSVYRRYRLLLVILFGTGLLIILCKHVWVNFHVFRVLCYTSGFHLFCHATEVLLIMVF